MTYTDLRTAGGEVRAVEVLVDGQWTAGELEAYRQDGDGAWRGWVRWAAGVGQNRVDWFGEDRLRKVDQ